MFKNLFITLFSLVFTIITPNFVIAQTTHLLPPLPGYHYEKVCYTSLIPFPHSQCDYRLVRHYTVIVPRHKRYMPDIRYKYHYMPVNKHNRRPPPRRHAPPVHKPKQVYK